MGILVVSRRGLFVLILEIVLTVTCDVDLLHEIRDYIGTEELVGEV